MATCPNKNLKEWKDLVAFRGENIAYFLWDKHEGNIPSGVFFNNAINYNLKSIEILLSEKANQIFTKGKKNNWSLDKVLTELQIPKEQKQIILDKKINNREEIITSLLADNSFVVKINTAKGKATAKFTEEGQILEGLRDKDYFAEQVFNEGVLEPMSAEYFNEIDRRYNEYLNSNNTQYYSNLTVPGGTNYTENEIATPAITPAIKGHAQFSSDNGIGWFRSDEQVLDDKSKIIKIEQSNNNWNKGKWTVEYKTTTHNFSIGQSFTKTVIKDFDTEEEARNFGKVQTTQTRRILEVQSDLFQKGRDLKNLDKEQIDNNNLDYRIKNIDDHVFFRNGVWKFSYGGTSTIIEGKSKEEVIKKGINHFKSLKTKETTDNKNKFLQLLNKNNNWVTFFIKSIIQDSVKKGYEKVLFPTGNTIAKIEQFQTLEEFKKQKEDRIKELEKRKYSKDDVVFAYFNSDKPFILKEDTDISAFGVDSWNSPEEYVKEQNNKKQNEINQLKQELKRVEEQGFKALSPVADFYENTVANILNKNYSVNKITDEYNNTWNEIKINNNRDIAPVSLQLKGTETTPANPNTIAKVKEVITKMGVSLQDLQQYLKGNPDVQAKDANALADLIHNIIAVAKGKESVALTEEMVHVATAILEQTNPSLITEIISKIGKYKIYKDTLEAYKDNPNYQLSNGKPNIRKIKKEAADKLIVEAIIANNEGSEFYPELYNEGLRAYLRKIWEKILNFFNKKYEDTNINLFQEAARIILEDEFGTVEDIAENQKDIYLQISDAQKDMQRRIEDTKKLITKKIVEDPDKTFYLDTDKVDNWYELVTEPGKALKRVTDRVKRWYRNKFKDKTFSEWEKQFNEFKREAGTKYHQFMEIAHERYFNSDGTLKSQPGERAVFSGDDNKIYNKLDKYYRDLIQEYTKDGKTPLFFSEVMIYDPKQKEAGTIDLLIVEEDGTTHIYDWKFMSVNAQAKDVAWFKQGAYNIQLKRYKNILLDFYGIKKIGKNRAVPILFDIKSRSTLNKKERILKIQDIAIGDVNPSTIDDLRLAPVSEETESTGIKALDDLISKLNAVHSRISQEDITSDEEKEFKRERLNILKHAVRKIQTTLDVEPLADVISVMRREGDNLLQDYEIYFKNGDPNDPAYTEQMISDFSDSLRDYIAISDAFKSIGKGIYNIIYQEGDEALAITSAEKEKVEHAKNLVKRLQSETLDIANNNEEIREISKEFADRFIGQRNLVSGILNANKEIKSLGSWFRGVSDLSLPALDVLFKSVTNAKSKASRDAFERITKLTEIKNNLEKRGGDLRKIIDPIYQKDAKGRRLNKLVYKYDRKFYDSVDENASSDKPSKAWIIKNIDLASYNKVAEELVQNKIAYYKRIYDDKKLILSLSIEEARKYDIERDDFNGWNNYLLKKFPKDQWISEEYKNIQKDKDLFELYNFISETNEKANEIGYIENKVRNTFLPFVRKGFAESLAWDASLSAIQRLGDDLTLRDDDVGYGKMDALSKEYINSIPKYYTKDFTFVSDEELNRRIAQFEQREGRAPSEEEVKDLERDMTDVSEDLFKNLSLYITHLEKYNYLSQIEGQLNLIKDIESFKGHLETTTYGKAALRDGEVNEIEGNEINTKLYINFLNAMLYGQKYPISSTDIPLGIGKAVEYGKQLIGKAIGRPYEPKENPSPTSLMKTIDAGNRYFQLKTLGLNMVSGFANLFGVSIQINAQGGIYFKSREFGKNALKLIGNKFNKTDEREMFIQLMNTFMPLKDDPSYEMIKKLGMTKLTQENFSDMLMVFMRAPELHVERSIFLTLLENSMVDETGRIINIREFVKNKYKNRYNSSSEYRQTKRAIDTEIETLKKEKSIWATKKLVDGKLEIPGLDLTNQKEIQRLTNLTRRISRNATGSLSDSDVNRISMNVIGRSAMVFKSWIPKLVDTRFGEFRKISDDFSVEIDENGLTTGEKYDIGRARLFGYVVGVNIIKGAKRLSDILQVTEDGIVEIDKLYNHYAEQYMKRTGVRLTFNPETGEYNNFMTKEEFTDLIRTNLRNQLKELALLLTLVSVTIAVPPPDEDMTKSEKNFYRFTNKVIKRFVSELSFFYNPAEYQRLLSGNIFPVLGVAKDIERFTSHLFMELTGLDISNLELTKEEVFKKAQPVKHGARLFPFFKELLNYLAMLDDDFAKDFDITIRDSY